MISSSSVAVFLLFVLIYWDFRRIQKMQTFNSNLFNIKRTFAGGLLIAFIILMIVDKNWWEVLPVFFLMTVFPLYVLRRSYFFQQKSLFIQSENFVSDAFGVLIHWGYGVVVFGLFSRMFTKYLPADEKEIIELLISAVFSTILFLILIVKASIKFSNKGLLHNLSLHRNNLSFFRLIGLPIGMGLMLASISAYLVVERSVQPQTPLSEALASSESYFVIIIFMLMALIVAPFVEEVIFRGYFYKVIKKAKGVRTAFFSIALTFAFLHVGQYWGDWLAILMVTLMGFVLTFLRMSTGSTIPSVITHYVYNAGVTIIPIFLLMISNQPYFKYQLHYPTYDSQTKEKLLLESLRIDPDLAEAYNNLAWLYVQEDKKLEEALTLTDKALSFDNKSTTFLDTKADVLTKLKRYDEAKEIREKIIELTSSLRIEKYQREKILELSD